MYGVHTHSTAVDDADTIFFTLFVQNSAVNSIAYKFDGFHFLRGHVDRVDNTKQTLTKPIAQSE